MSGSVVDVATPDDCASDEEDLQAQGSTSVPVGITIAYKRQEKGFADEEKIRHKQTPVSSKSKSKRKATSSAKKKIKQEELPKSTSFRVFLETSAIYILCVVLPTVIGYLYNCYAVWKYEHEVEQEDSSPGNQGESTSLGDSAYQWLSSTVYNPTIDYACQPDDGTSYAWSWVSSALAYTGLCSGPDDELNRTRSVLSDDVSAWSDVFTVALCSFMLAVVRITIVRYTVPMEDSSDVEALVRSKSIHLLSSDYVMTPIGTPVSRKSVTDLSMAAAVASLPLPPLNHTVDHDHDDDMFGVAIDASEREEDYDIVPLPHTTTVDPTSEFAPRQGIPPQDQGETEGVDPASLVQSLTTSLEKSSSAKRSYAAPRCATALFRLVYSMAAVAIALIYFRDANFWPWYVFGQGSTEKCWDLSGGLTVGMDSDFDHRNVVLKRYFLWQASYHWHSGAFHILSLLFLLLHPTKHAPRRFLSLKSSTSAYVRRLSQHGLAVALIAVAYVFSSLRRLVAIGVFAFDLSSLFLHLLQVCINAPDNSRWKSNAVITRVYWFLVIPSFVIARFLIWPCLWYSATFESTFWLTQLEKTLWPGAGALFRNTIHFLMLILQVFTVIYFRRLLNHPHVQGLLHRRKQEAA